MVLVVPGGPAHGLQPERGCLLTILWCAPSHSTRTIPASEPMFNSIASVKRAEDDPLQCFIA